jgi:hypothetical protein
MPTTERASISPGVTIFADHAVFDRRAGHGVDRLAAHGDVGSCQGGRGETESDDDRGDENCTT